MTQTKNKLWCGICGPFFLKSLLNSSNDTFFIQNEDWEQNDVILVKTLSFWTNKKLSYDDFLMTSWEQEPEEKGTTNFASMYLVLLSK